MRAIAERSLLLRVGADLPEIIKLRTEDFRDGWCSVKRLSAKNLEKKIRTQAWSFLRVADASLKSGVGETSQLAIARALTLALRTISANFNAVEVESIRLTQYPWFFVARVSISPYRIQQNASLPPADEAQPIPLVHLQTTVPYRSGEPYPHFVAEMPRLKAWSISSQPMRRESL
jgi:hypothetical protein